jgi:hypothetical protein
MQVGVDEHLPQPLDVAVEVAATAGLGQQPAQPRRVSVAAWAGVGAAAKMARASRRASPPPDSSANATRAAG